MDLKKEFCHRNIKEETESEPYNNTPEIFVSSSNLLQVKFEDSSYVNQDSEDQIENALEAIVNAGHIEKPNQLKECKTIPFTKNLDADTTEKQLERQICRLCAQHITGNEIFLYEDSDLEQKINYALPITAGIGDGLPEFICRNCEINLNMFYDFVCQVVNADKRIRGQLNPPDVKTSDVNDVTSATIMQIFGELEQTDEGNVRLVETESETLCDLKTSSSKDTSKRLLQEDDLKVSSKSNFLHDKEPSVDSLQLEDSDKPRKIQKLLQVSDTSTQQIQTDHPYKCQYCDQHFSDYFTLIDHNKQFHHIIRYPCPETECTESFTTEKSLRQHTKDNHNVPVICFTCGKIFAHREALQKHRDNKHFHKVCGTCGMSFKSTVSYETHKSLHVEVAEYQCVYCYKNFKNRHKLHRHTRQCHSGNFTLLVDGNEDDAKKG